MGTLLDGLSQRHVVAAVIWMRTNCTGRCSLNLGRLKATCEGFWDHLLLDFPVAVTWLEWSFRFE